MKNILFIESRTHALRELIEKLENEGHIVEAFENTKDALEGIHIHSPDLIVLDSETVTKQDILNLVNSVSKNPHLQNTTVCLITQSPEEYQDLNVSVVRSHPNAQEVRGFLSQPKLATAPLDYNVFKEVAEEVFGFQKPHKRETQELEHKLEMLKRDSHILLQSKDKKILDLKRRIDALELEITELSSQIENSYETLRDWSEKTIRVLKALKMASKQLEECKLNLPNFKKNV